MKMLLHVAVDVDDKNFHGAGYCSKGGGIFEFKCQPTAAALLQQLRKLQRKGYKLKTCHEATHVGYSLHRQLEAESIDSCIIAPSLIPKLPGKQVKTDSVDARGLAMLFAKGMLTPVSIPDETDEQCRAIIRSRAFQVRQRANLKRHILSLMRTLGYNYKQETASKSYWTKAHLKWLQDSAKTSSEEVAANIGILLGQLASFEATIAQLDGCIDRMSSLPKYAKQAAALCCFRGVGVLSAMIFLTEIGDARRFSHPRKLSSYAGFSVREYSSGGKEKKFGITKMGNRYLRTGVVEACQRVGMRYMLSKRLKEARKGQPQQVLDIADRCMRRLRKRYMHLVHRNKPVNKVKVACGREMLSFVWEMMCAVA